MFPHVSHLAHPLYSESENDLRIHQSGVMSAGRCIQRRSSLPAQQPVSHEDKMDSSRQRKPLMAQKKKEKLERD